MTSKNGGFLVFILLLIFAVTASRHIRGIADENYRNHAKPAAETFQHKNIVELVNDITVNSETGRIDDQLYRSEAIDIINNYLASFCDAGVSQTAGPLAAGTIDAFISVDTSGFVTEVHVGYVRVSDEKAMDQVKDCLLAEMRNWQFPHYTNPLRLTVHLHVNTPKEEE